MRILVQGCPFFCDERILTAYSGPHEFRMLGHDERADIQYDPCSETIADIVSRLAPEWSPDLLMCWAPDMYPPPLGIEDAPIPTAAFVSDWNLFYPMLERNLARYDYVFCDTPGLRVLRNEWVSPCHIFPLYSQINAVHRPSDTPKDIDIVFVGNLNPAAHAMRNRFLGRVGRLADRYRVVIKSELSREDYATLLGRARIVFNHSIRGELNLRVFETLACGALPFLEADNLEVRQWFQDGIDIVLYNEHDLEEKLEWYLSHPDEVAAVTKRAHARAPEFAGENRLDALVEGIVSRPSTGRRFGELPPFERAFHTWFQYSRSRWDVLYSLEDRLVRELVNDYPNEARAWTAFALYALRWPQACGGGEERLRTAYVAFDAACRLAPRSAPFALNAAHTARALADSESERRYLDACAAADDLTGSGLLIWNHTDLFWGAWQRAVAEGTASLPAIHAEAHIRKAALSLREGDIAAALCSVDTAEKLAPDHAGVLSMRAACWEAAGEMHRAADCLLEYVQKLPLDLEQRTHVAELLEEQGRSALARPFVEETIRIADALLAEWM